MRISKTERNCPICGTAFTPKTINSRYCSEQCSRKAYKRKVAEEKRQQELDAIAESVPDNRPYISVPEAIAIYGVAKSTLYRLIRKGHILAINPISKHIRKFGIPMRHQGNSIYVPKTEIHKLYK